MEEKDSKKIYNRYSTALIVTGLVLDIANKWIESNIVGIIAITLIALTLIKDLNDWRKSDKKLNKWGQFGTIAFMAFLGFCWIFVVVSEVLDMINK